MDLVSVFEYPEIQTKYRIQMGQFIMNYIHRIAVKQSSSTCLNCDKLNNNSFSFVKNHSRFIAFKKTQLLLEAEIKQYNVTLGNVPKKKRKPGLKNLKLKLKGKNVIEVLAEQRYLSILFLLDSVSQLVHALWEERLNWLAEPLYYQMSQPNT